MKMQHIQGHTFHARRGALKNTFRYGVDYILCDLDEVDHPAVLSRNRLNLWSLWDRKHGGPRGDGRGVDWFREMLALRGFPMAGTRLLLLTQPSFLWFHFNPVSFWIAERNGNICAFVAEVNNTFGHRHCYFCAQDDFRPIGREDTITAQKLLHVSPFQKVEGHYRFNFEMTEDLINIRILFENKDAGVLATLAGARQEATNRSLISAAFKRPFGAARVVAFIYWQALVLYFKRAPFRKKPAPPQDLMSHSTTIQGESKQ